MDAFLVRCMKCGEELNVVNKGIRRANIANEYIKVEAGVAGYGGECVLAFECSCGNRVEFEDF